MSEYSPIPFNKPFIIGNELAYIEEAVASGKISGNGVFTERCQRFFEQTFGFPRCLLTTSCTDALEMSALLIDLKPGDEVIVPSYTFVSTANAFVLHGARVVFADSEARRPHVDPERVAELITDRTRAIVPVHYGGTACDMDPLMTLAERHDLQVVEDAAQALRSRYRGRVLGSIGHLGTISFHETKNVICGEGGALFVNHERYRQRAEIIWEKGTDRAAFFRGEIDKYGWVDVGSSFLPSELVAAFLYGQLEHLDRIQRRRETIWNAYAAGLQEVEERGWVRLPWLPDYATNNAHLFYLVCGCGEERDRLIAFLRGRAIHAVFHYLSLHRSPYYEASHDGRDLPNADRYSSCLLRLPMFLELADESVARIIDAVRQFYGLHSHPS